MTYRVYQQPDGRYAVFSSIVDDFMFIDGTESETRSYLRHDLGKSSGATKSLMEQAKSGEYPHSGCPKSIDGALRLAKLNNQKR